MLANSARPRPCIWPGSVCGKGNSPSDRFGQQGPDERGVLSNYLDKYLSVYIIHFVKSLRFIGSSLDDLKDFPAEARREAGFELHAVQSGLMPSDFKPMLNVGPGVYEIRVRVMGEWRVIYVAKFDDAVYVLHTFQKKTQKTRKEDIDLATKRYRQIGD